MTPATIAIIIFVCVFMIIFAIMLYFHKRLNTLTPDAIGSYWVLNSRKDDPFNNTFIKIINIKDKHVQYVYFYRNAKNSESDNPFSQSISELKMFYTRLLRSP